LTSDSAHATSVNEPTIREGLDAVRRTNDERQRRALDLQRTVRYEQQAVTRARMPIAELSLVKKGLMICGHSESR